MKKLIIMSGFIFFAFVMDSCTKENSDNGKTYYKFVDNDYNYIINYNYIPEQIIIYENQFGEQLHFKVISNIAKKEGQYSGGGFLSNGSSLDYYYDNKTIRLEIIENQSNYLYDLIIYNFSKSLGVFKNGMNFPLWNVSDSTFYDEIDRPFNIGLTSYNSIAKTQMNINGHLFGKVVKIESNSSVLTNSNWAGLLQNHINKVYYDYDFGIIEFDDLDGKNWKVKYP
jgi:hypothetical protein